MSNVMAALPNIGGALFSTPQQISTAFSSWLRYCSDVAHRRPTKLCTCLAVSWAATHIYIFGGSCLLTKFCQLQNSFCVQVLRCPILERNCTALQHQASAKLRHVSTIGFLSDCRYMPQLRRHSQTKLCDGAEMAIFCVFFTSCISNEPRAAHFRPPPF